MSIVTEVALLSLKPLSLPIQRRVLTSYDFQEKIGLNGLTTSYKLTGRVRIGDLLDAVRRVCKTNVDEKITNLDGQDIFLSMRDGRVAVGKSLEDTKKEPFITELSLLSPDPQERLDAFKVIAYRYGPTGPDSQRWELLLSERAPSNREFSELFDAIESSVPNFQFTFQSKVDARGLMFDDLLPSKSSYFLKFCGPFPVNGQVDEYINGQLNEHHRAFFLNDFSAGLQLCLPGNIRHRILPVQQLKDIPDEDILNFVRNMSSISDPFSILSLVEISLLRRHNVPELNELARTLIARLCSETLPRHDGIDVYTFYPALVLFCLNRIRLIDGMLNRPAFWHRLCAFTHAGILTKMFESFQFDPQEVSQLLKSGQSQTDAITDILAFRDEPMWRPERLTRDFLQAEICGRLKIIAVQEEKDGHQMPHLDLVDKNIARLEKKGIISIWPGPLEGHLRPIKQKLERDFFHIQKGILQELFNKSVEKFPWHQAAYISEFETLSTEFRGAMVRKIPGLFLSELDVSEQVGTLTNIALIAIYHEDDLLASALADRVSDMLGEFDNIQVIFFLTLMASCAVNKKEWLSWLIDRLERLARIVPSGVRIKAFKQLLEALKYNLPISQWKFGNAEALCGAAAKREIPVSHISMEVLHGNRKTKTFHQSDCKYYASGNRKKFKNRSKAIEHGYKPCAKCNP